MLWYLYVAALPVLCLVRPSLYLVVATRDHDHHRRRRGHATGFLSKGSILRSGNLIADKVDHLARRLESAYHEGSVLSLRFVFAALAGDVITICVYGTSMSYLNNQ